MNFIDKLEQKLGRFAIRNLMLYLIIFYIIGFILNVTNENFYWEYLSLNVYEILHGQVYRLITFLCYPPSESIIWFLLISFIYFSLGKTLEMVWGTFRFNLYIFLGILGVILAAFISYFCFGEVYLLTADRIYLSMLLGMAATFPDMTFLLYFIIPIKAKWLGILYGGILLYEVISDAIAGEWTSVIVTVLSLLNFFVFFVFIRNKKGRSHGSYGGAAGAGGFFAEKKSTQKGSGAKVYDFDPKADIKSKAGSVQTPRHRCSVCGITDIDAPDMEFRYCSKCNGAYEYCSNHIYTHIHK